jgi:hypothetical protein
VSVCSLSGIDENWNFSAVRGPIGPKLGGDLGLVSQISVHFWFQDLIVFLYWKQTKEEKNGEITKIIILENLSFLSRAESD